MSSSKYFNEFSKYSGSWVLVNTETHQLATGNILPNGDIEWTYDRSKADLSSGCGIESFYRDYNKDFRYKFIACPYWSIDENIEKYNKAVRDLNRNQTN